jgi:hypothetical protein
MNKELIAEVVSDLAELSHPSTESREEPKDMGEPPDFVIPSPPIPGKTAWSIAPW